MIKVLIVDDDKLARKGIISLMDWKKYHMEVVGDVQDGKAALEFLQENEANLVFVDIDMPQMDGIEFMERCSEEKPDIRFVVLTFYEEFSYAQSAIRLGSLDYLSKASLEFGDSDAILERIERKYEERNRGIVSRGKREGKDWQSLKEQWESLYWIFDTILYRDLVEKTRVSEIDLRILERQMVRCVGKLDELLERCDTNIPWFQSTEEILEWMDQIRTEYRNCDSAHGNEFVSILKAVKIVEKNFTHHIHASEVAREIGISRSYFCMRFKKYVGVTFGDFIQNLRIQKSQELLLNTKWNIMEVAYQSGYEDVYYFNRVFREKMQCSPNEYRKNRAIPKEAKEEDK